MTKLDKELAKARDQIEEYAKRYGLDFFDTAFEVVTPEEMLIVAAREGFPSRYEHWRWGMEHRKMRGMHEAGAKIYELVINTNPALAYLLNDTPLTQQKVIMGHVLGHVDFFKNNQYYSKTDRKMLETMADHRDRVNYHTGKQGLETVEDYIDATWSLTNLIDFQAIGAPGPGSQRDIMLFLMENAPLDDWQQEILGILRDETYYFAPQRKTKIMNEGWATYWHTKLMRGEDFWFSRDKRSEYDIPVCPAVLDWDEVHDYAHMHSGVVATKKTQINPYKLGFELYKDIERRWNRGMFGRDFEEETDLRTLVEWDTEAAEGRDFLFTVREAYTDVGFISEFLTKDFCREQKMFVYEYNERTDWYEISDTQWEAVKDALLRQLSNAGEPVINVKDDNFKSQGELLLNHEHPGSEEWDLKHDEALETLVSLYNVWKKPVHIHTFEKGKQKLLSYDGRNHAEKDYTTSEKKAQKKRNDGWGWD